MHTSCSRVCVECGLEEAMLTLDSYSTFSAPLLKGYQREVRFRQKIDKLLSLQNSPPFYCPVWSYLESKRPLFTPKDIRKALRTYQGKNKHYDNIRLFTRVFTKFRVKIKRNVYDLNALLTKYFLCVVRLWNCYNITDTMPFFSYDYLLRVFLETLECPLVVYCKPIACQKRHMRNGEKLALILARDGGGTYCQSSAEARSLSATHS